MTISKMSKIVVLFLVIATILSATSIVLASGITIPTGNSVSAAGFGTTVSNIIGVIQTICYAAAVILIVILGVKFMTASPDGKAEIKKSAVIYVVGAILVFAAGLILQLIKNLGTSVVNTGN